MPPKTGAILFIVSIISSVSCVLRHIGKALIPPYFLKSIALPSITGIAAKAPRLPIPSIAEPSDIIATVFPFIV